VHFIRVVELDNERLFDDSNNNDNDDANNVTIISISYTNNNKLPSAIIADKTERFLIKYDSVNNLLFKLSRLPL